MSNYLQFNENYLQLRSKDWPFLKSLQIPRSTTNAIYNEIVDHFNQYAQKMDYSYEQYEEYLDHALGVFYNLNMWVIDSLKKDDVNNYHQYWVHQKFSLEQYFTLGLDFPNNIETLIPDIMEYIESPHIESRIINWSLVDIILFKELKAQSSSIYFSLTMRKRGIFSSIFSRKKNNGIDKLSALLDKLYNAYLQCDSHLFHPSVIYELCLDIRKQGDYYEGAVFEILEKMIKHEQFHVRHF